MYPNANAVKERILALARSASPRVVVLDLEVSTELDVQSADMLGELAGELTDQVSVEPTLDAATR